VSVCVVHLSFEFICACCVCVMCLDLCFACVVCVLCFDLRLVCVLSVCLVFCVLLVYVVQVVEIQPLKMRQQAH